MSVINQIGWRTALLLLIGTSVSQADPPPNDDFANRIVLTGNDIVFTGTLVGATIEHSPNDPNGAWEVWDYYHCAPPSGTVWWSWKATLTSPVTIESLDSNADGYECLTVWPPPNPQRGFPVTTNFNVEETQPVGFVSLATPRTYGIFLATNETTYSFQLGGFSASGGGITPTSSFRFRLTASAAPVIKEQPLSLTVLSNASALFKIHAVGVPYLNYQWQFNGEDIPGEHAIVLGLTNVTPAQRGGYTARVSNSGGSVTSAMATLEVKTEDLPPLL